MADVCAVDVLGSAVNEGDPAIRDSLLREVWDDDTRLVIEGETVARGRPDLDRWIEDQRRDDPKFCAKTTAAVDRVGAVEWGRWERRRLREGTDVLDVVGKRRSEDGLMLDEVALDPPMEAKKGGTVASRLQDAVVGNPIPVVGLLGGTLYLAARLPVTIFYGNLGVTPDEVGLGPEVVVPTAVYLSATVLLVVAALFAVMRLLFPTIRAFEAAGRMRQLGERRRGNALRALLWVGVVAGFIGGLVVADLDRSLPMGVSVAILIVVATGAAFLTGIAARAFPGVRPHLTELEDQYRRRADRWDVARGLLTLTVAYVGLAFVALPLIAAGDAESVRGGASSASPFAPWRAVRVSLHWNRSEHVPLTNDCKNLRLLGAANGRTVLFDNTTDRVFRISESDADVIVYRRGCPSPPRRTPPAP